VFGVLIDQELFLAGQSILKESSAFKVTGALTRLGFGSTREHGARPPAGG